MLDSWCLVLLLTAVLAVSCSEKTESGGGLLLIPDGDLGTMPNGLHCPSRWIYRRFHRTAQPGCSSAFI